MATQQIAIYGAGGFAREVVWLVEECDGPAADSYEVVCFIDDQPRFYGQSLNDIPVVSLQEARERFPAAAVVSGIGNPRTREQLMERARDAGFGFATVVHPSVRHSRWLEIGDGTVVCAGTLLTTNITLGQHVQINLDCTIGHDVIMGDYTTLAPGVHVSGWVHMGKRVYVGTGASIINGTEEQPLIIEDDAVIGAAACVTKAVGAGSTVVGVPAKLLNR